MSTTKHPRPAQNVTSRPGTAARAGLAKLPMCQSMPVDPPLLRAGVLHPLPAQLSLSMASPPPYTHVAVGSASVPTALLPQGLQREGEAAAAPQGHWAGQEQPRSSWYPPGV